MSLAGRQVQHSDGYLRHWLRALAQPVTYLAVMMLVCIYCTLVYLLITDREIAEYDAGRRADNLAHVVDQSFAHIFKSVDATLLFLRKSYQRNPSTFDLATWVADPSIRNELIFDFGILDASGAVVASSFSSNGLGIDRSDREYFRAHANSTTDELFISKPVILGVNGKRSILLTRRITASDGTFAGVILAMLDPSELIKHVGTVDLGPEGSIALVGLDSYLRTRSVNGTIDWKNIGRKVRLIPETLGRAFQVSAGHYWSVPGVFNNVRRLVSYRVLESFPLISVVTISEAEVYRRANENARIYWGIALVLTVATAITFGFGALRERKLMATTSEMKQTQEALALANQELIEKQYAIDQTLTVSITDAKGDIIYVNDNFCRISGHTREELLGNNHRMVNSGTHPKTFFRDLYRKITNGEVWRGEVCNKAKNGSLYWVDTTIVPQLGPDGKPVTYMAIRVDITARKLAEAQIFYIARHDSLTGIANRTVLLAKMEEALARLRRHQEAFTILIFDLDGFKYINDTLGHTAGDKLLKELSQRLTSSLRETDILARLGGDEFAIIQSGAENQREANHREEKRREENQREAAIGLALRVLEIAANPFDLDGHNVTVGASIGIAVAPEDGTNVGELLQKADLALYRVKSEGRNNFRFFDAEMSKGASERLQLLADMRAALTRKEFELFYQSIFDAKTRRACGVEALVRWRHPVHGLMPPDRFIPLAEEAGLMEPLGEWILEQACSDAMSWPDDIKVAVNLSAVQFRSGKLFDVILCALVDSGLPPERLELEITESVLMQNVEGCRDVIQQLKNIGISAALDDFGTGYSSLSYLTMFPFDKIKIDQSFVSEL